MKFRLRVCEIFGRQWTVCCADQIVMKASVECGAVKHNSLQRVITEPVDI